MYSHSGFSLVAIALNTELHEEPICNGGEHVDEGTLPTKFAMYLLERA